MESCAGEEVLSARRRVLKVLADDLEDLFYKRIDFLGVSLPARVGKSTLCIFFITC